MAQFKIELLTSVTDHQYNSRSVYYLTSVITDFQSPQLLAIQKTLQHKIRVYQEESTENKSLDTFFQTLTTPEKGLLKVFKSEDLTPEVQNDFLSKQFNSYSFSFDEKLSIHKNAQKELTFSMIKKIFYNNEYIENPYVSNLHIGSQLLLTDQYNNEFLFTVSSISFKIEDLNITYQYTCQDSFNYQLTHQNEGYEIVNDATSTEFLGAQTIDYGAQKICKECYNTYDFIPTLEGLALKNDQTLELYSDDKTLIQNYQLRNSEQLADINTILKDIYNDQYYQQHFPFSCSNSNGAAALISLGEELGCGIHVLEKSYKYNNQLYFHKKFGFEPLKQNRPSGLKYSPHTEIQNFNFSLKGNNLATVYNILPTKNQDQIISLFPHIPGVFQDGFISPEGEDTIYKRGMFTNYLNGEEQTSKGEAKTIKLSVLINDIIVEKNIVGVSFEDTNLKLYSRYPVCDFTVGQQHTAIADQTNQSIPMYLFLPCIATKTTEQVVYYIAIPENTEIPTEGFQQTYPLITKNHIYYPYIGYYSSALSNSKSIIYLNTHRFADETEEAFAKIADKCPWLENKLINFDYFLNNKIISLAEYQDLKYMLNNDVRIINGQLMAYAQQYFTKIHTQTKVINTITTNLDTLGATVAHLIKIYTEEGTIPQADGDLLSKRYHQLFQDEIPDRDQYLLDRDQLLSDYFNKAFYAEQRFFKHIKKFQDYFNSLDNFTQHKDAGIYDYSIYAQYNEKSIVNHHLRYYSFPSETIVSIFQKDKDGKVSLNPSIIHDNNIYSDIYSLQDKQYTKLIIPTADLINRQAPDWPSLIVTPAQPVLSLAQGEYRPNNKYMVNTEKYTDIDIKGRYTIRQDGHTYVEILPQELIALLLKDNTSQAYYVRKHNHYIPFDWIRYPISDKIFAPFQNVYYELMPLARGYVDTGSSNESNQQAFLNNYVHNFPLSNIYFYGSLYHKVPQEEPNNKNISVRYERYNSHYGQEEGDKLRITHMQEDPTGTDIQQERTYGKKPTDFYTFQTIPFANSLPSGATTIANLDLDSYLESVTSGKEAFNYFAYAPDPVLQTYHRNLNIATGVFGALAFIPVFGVIATGLGIASAICSGQSYVEENCKGVQHESPYRYFTPTIEKNGTDYKITRLPIDSIDKFNNNYGLFARTSDSAYQADLATLNAFQQGNIFTEDVTSKDSNGIVRNGEYFNYYGFLVATYSFEYQRPLKEDNTLIPAYDNEGNPAYTINTYGKFIPNYKLGVKNPVYQRILTKKDYLYKYDKYYVIVLDTSTDQLIDKEGNKTAMPGTLFKDGKWPHFNPGMKETDKPLKFNDLQYYGLPKTLLNLNALPDNYGVNNCISLDELRKHMPGGSGYNELQDNNKNSFIFQATENGRTYTFILTHYEPYETIFVSTETSNLYTNGDNFKINYKDIESDTIYSSTTHAPVDLLEEINFDEHKDGEIQTFDPAEQIGTQNIDLTDIKMPLFILNTSNQQYIPTYSLEQLKAIVEQYNKDKTTIVLPNLYFFENQIKHEYRLSNDLKHKKFITTLYAHDIEFDTTDTKILRHQIAHINNCVLDFTSNTSITVNVSKDYDQTYNTTFDLYAPTTPSIQLYHLTNGELGYNFHTNNQYALLNDLAIIIETQLTEEGNQALNASTFCHYFIPDSWMPNMNKKQNALFSDLIQVSSDSTDITNKTNVKHVKLSNKILPQIYTYNKGYNNRLTNTLPRYKFIYHSDIIVNDSMTLLENIPLRNFLEIDNDNTPKEVLKNGECIEEGQTTYYYTLSNQGILGKDILQIIQSNQKGHTNTTLQYDMLNGGYLMMFAVLNRYLTDTPSKYLKLQENKLALGQKIYSLFPNVLLERNYQNNNAITSEQLGQTANLSFRDQIKPEEAYNLTLINTHLLQGYKGQELHIGDPIQLDAIELYDSFDDIYTLLNQFLFITDISYNLRKDSDTNVTVNTVKYEEKLLQQLVKLIR